MSKYTTEVRYICEVAAGYEESKGFDNVDTIITAAAPAVFNFDFPIFDEAYRVPLEKKILRHYYTREIGLETVGLWKLKLQDKLNMIMPYYNQLYKSELLEFNPLYDVDLTTNRSGNAESDNSVLRNEEGTGSRNSDRDISRKLDGGESRNVEEKTSTNTGRVAEGETVNSETSSGTTTGTNVDNSKNRTTQTDSKSKDEWRLYSDTPQGGITGIERANDGATNPQTGELIDNAYLTNATHTFGTDSTTASENVNTVENSGTTTGSSENKTNGNTKQNTSSSEVGFGDRKQGEVVNKFDNEKTAEGITENNAYGKVGSEFGNIKTTNEYIEHVNGKRGGMTYSKMLMEFRETFLNIDKMVIDELSDLFMLIW